MRNSLKIAAVAAVLFLVLGAVAFVYASSRNALNANADEQQTEMQIFSGPDNQNFFRWNNCTVPGHMTRMPHGQADGLQSLKGFLENATLSTVQGTVVSEARGMLILNTDSSQVRVLLPKDWSVGNAIVGRISLFNSTFASSGQTVTVKVLESNVFSNSNFSINVMMGYEAINATGTHAYAVLPFNIQPNS
jgi:hypothetical protein